MKEIDIKSIAKGQINKAMAYLEVPRLNTSAHRKKN